VSRDDYEAVIGLEVHVQLLTKSKLFSTAANQFGSEPNKNTTEVCFGWPGSLPVLNEEAVRLAVRVGLALNCKIAEFTKFDRKHYFYPDLPKAYQISQFDMPINGPGQLLIESKDQAGQTYEKMIRVHRAHLEEDAGKLLHEGIEGSSLVDYNRAGVPLLEIVSEPDMSTPEEAYAYLTALKSILEYLGVSDCNMEEGSLRCDANISVRKKGATELGTKTEVKNLNSFKMVQRASQYEIERQIEMVENGERVTQETRLWNDIKGQTFLMRTKEGAHDYRYFPEPDLVPITLTKEWISNLRKGLPELPQARTKRFKESLGLSPYDAMVLVQDKDLGDYFEEVLKSGVNPKLASNWIQSELLALLNEKKLSIVENPVSAKTFAGLVQLIERETISGKIGKDVLPIMIAEGKTADAIVQEKGWIQVTDAALIEKIADKVIAENQKSVEDFKAGKKQALGFLIGQLMKQSQGKANPKLANEVLTKKLS
jgi:aspartyl-tRNA(Asn)/glutamyl-tRNA(Gln) amidotransferase subunit B